MLIACSSFALVAIVAILLVVSLFKCSEACFDDMCEFFERLLDIFEREKLNDEQQFIAIEEVKKGYVATLKHHTDAIK